MISNLFCRELKTVKHIQKQGCALCRATIKPEKNRNSKTNTAVGHDVM